MSGNVFFHNLTSGLERNSISANRCFRVRGTHDLEVRQHVLSVSGLSCRRSTTWSSNSAKGEGSTSWRQPSDQSLRIDGCAAQSDLGLNDLSQCVSFTGLRVYVVWGSNTTKETVHLGSRRYLEHRISTMTVVLEKKVEVAYDGTLVS